MTAHAEIDSENGAEAGALIDLGAFSAAPFQASVFPGLGGTVPPPDPSYAFHTGYVRPALGAATFEARLSGLRATRGTLVLHVSMVSEYPGTHPRPMRTVPVALADLAAAGGVARVAIVARRNMLYALAGNVYDETDATAEAISVVLDRLDDSHTKPAARNRREQARRAKEADRREAIAAKAQLLTLDVPTLAEPTSQIWTAEQQEERALSTRTAALGLQTADPFAQWEATFVLQVLDRYGLQHAGAAGLRLGHSVSPLPAYLAAHDNSILLASPAEDVTRDSDLGLSLEQFARPDLCPLDRFYDAVHFTTVSLTGMPGIGDFDYLWSTGVADQAPAMADFIHIANGAMACLRPGGIAVHLLQHATPGGFRDGCRSYSRQEIERLALAMIAQGHEVAQLKFAASESVAHRGVVPFGLIARRGRA